MSHTPSLWYKAGFQDDAFEFPTSESCSVNSFTSSFPICTLFFSFVSVCLIVLTRIYSALLNRKLILDISVLVPI